MKWLIELIDIWRTPNLHRYPSPQRNWRNDGLTAEFNPCNRIVMWNETGKMMIWKWENWCSGGDEGRTYPVLTWPCGCSRVDTCVTEMIGSVTVKMTSRELIYCSQSLRVLCWYRSPVTCANWGGQSDRPSYAVIDIEMRHRYWKCGNAYAMLNNVSLKDTSGYKGWREVTWRGVGQFFAE